MSTDSSSSLEELSSSSSSITSSPTNSNFEFCDDDSYEIVLHTLQLFIAIVEHQHKYMNTEQLHEFPRGFEPEKVHDGIILWKKIMENIGLYNFHLSTTHTCSKEDNLNALQNIWTEEGQNLLRELMLHSITFGDRPKGYTFRLVPDWNLYGCFYSGRLHLCHPFREYRRYTCKTTCVFNLMTGHYCCAFSGQSVSLEYDAEDTTSGSHDCDYDGQGSGDANLEEQFLEEKKFNKDGRENELSSIKYRHKPMSFKSSRRSYYSGGNHKRFIPAGTKRNNKSFFKFASVKQQQNDKNQIEMTFKSQHEKDVISSSKPQQTQTQQHGHNSKKYHVNSKPILFMEDDQSHITKVLSNKYVENDDHENEKDSEKMEENLMLDITIPNIMLFKITDTFWNIGVQEECESCISSLKNTCLLIYWYKWCIEENAPASFSVEKYKTDSLIFWKRINDFVCKIYNIYHSYMDVVARTITTPDKTQRKCSIYCIILGLCDILSSGVIIKNVVIIDKIPNENIFFPENTNHLQFNIDTITVIYENQLRSSLSSIHMQHLKNAFESMVHYLYLLGPTNHALFFCNLVKNKSGEFNYKKHCSYGSKKIKEILQKCDMTPHHIRKLLYSSNSDNFISTNESN